MGGACSRYVGEEGRIQGLVGNLRARDHWEDSGVDGRIILKMDLQEVGWGNRLDRSDS